MDWCTESKKSHISHFCKIRVILKNVCLFPNSINGFVLCLISILCLCKSTPNLSIIHVEISIAFVDNTQFNLDKRSFKTS